MGRVLGTARSDRSWSCGTLVGSGKLEALAHYQSNRIPLVDTMHASNIDVLRVVFILTATASSNGNPVSQGSQAVTNVVNQAFCESTLTAEDKKGKKTLEEVHTYAELKLDPRASLPDSFTICSAIMTPRCANYFFPTFFTIFDNDRIQLLAPASNQGYVVNLLKIYFAQGASGAVHGMIPPLFPNHWARSCMAVNTTSGLLRWVVEGILVQTTMSKEVENSKNPPKDLSKKIVLGARSRSGVWFATSQKVTNLNIFSSALSIEKMKSITGGGSCVEEGDYLAWGDMEWILHGQARIETVDREEPCKGKPFVNLFYTPFPGMKACMRHLAQEFLL